MPLNSLTPYKSPRPDRLTVVDLSFDEWVSRPKPTPNRVKDHLRDAFHAGYHRGEAAEMYHKDPD